MSGDVRSIAFYLPQYHPIPENDAWWGKGFTEWTNVARTRPLFEGHYQPHLPSDLGFYDLRLPEARQAQAELAARYGIHGFCYYHYWFKGRRLLERPFNDVLTSGEPSLPFCLCWANESWSRRWDGSEREILMAQEYSAEDDLVHIQWLLKAFRDPRYIRVNGKPLFLIYKASRIPDVAATLRRWRKAAEEAGLPGLYLCNVESEQPEHGICPKFGFDAAVEFAPDWTILRPPLRSSRRWSLVRKLGLTNPAYGRHNIRDYDDLMQRMMAKPEPSYCRFPGVTPSWDNHARRKNGAMIFAGASPEKYQQWLEHAAARVGKYSPEERLVFINAWNEWAEGNHLEPCQKWGHAYLEATRAALAQQPSDQTTHAKAELAKA